MNRGTLFAALAHRMACFSTALLLLLGASRAYSATATWKSGATGNWNDATAAGWSATYPQNIGDIAQYASASALGATTLNVNNVTIGSLQNTGAKTWTINTDSNNYALNFQVSSGNATMSAANGSGLTVNPNLTLGSDLAVSTAAAATSTTIILNGGITGAHGVTLSANSTGAGFASVTVANLNNTGAVTVNSAYTGVTVSKTYITSIGSNVTSLTKTGNGELHINGGALSGTVTGDTTQTIKKDGAFSTDLVVSADNSLTFNGTWSAGISNDGTDRGTIQFNSANAIGGASSKIALAYTGIAVANYAIDQTFIDRINAGASTNGIIALGNGTSSSVALNMSSTPATLSLGAVGTANYSGTITPNAGYYLGGGGGTLYMDGTNQMTGASGLNIGSMTFEAPSRNASSVVYITGTNSYTGNNLLSAGATLRVSSISDGGVASSLGASAATAGGLNFKGGTLDYVGGTGSTNRLFTFSNNYDGTILANGSGPLSFTGTGSILFGTAVNSAKDTLTLGGANTGANTLAPLYGLTAGEQHFLVKSGIGTWVLSNAGNTYNAGTTISGGVLAITSDANLGAAYDGSLVFATGLLSNQGAGYTGNATLNVTSGTGGGSGVVGTGNMVGAKITSITVSSYGTGYVNNDGVSTTLTGGGYTTQAVAYSAVVKGLLTFDGGTLRTDAGITSSRAIYLNSAGTIDTNNFSSTFSGPITGTGTFTKAGLGTLTLSGANTNTGTTTVSAGTLSANATNALGSTSNITVTTGGTLLLNVNSATSNSTSLALAGGNLTMRQSGTGVSDSLGTLTLTANSTIDFGAISSGNNILTLGSVSSWTTGAILNIWNWTGTARTAGGVDRLMVSSTTGWTTTNLGNINFYSDSGSSLIGGGGAMFSGLEIVAVPEPGTFLVGLALLGFITGLERKRIASLLRANRHTGKFIM